MTCPRVFVAPHPVARRSRDDKASQWAYKGKPVHFCSGDKKAGEMAGDNFKDSWHVIR